ncbi:MAG: NAD-dependent epimerase/dehydratase family protein, partial [Candidatus Eisenbacteria bacterium]
MRILVLGGTKFVGRAFVDAARARGHALTLFNRGQEDPAAFPDVEQVRGDRTRGDGEGGFAPLSGRSFDAVVDTAAYLPQHARAAAEFFAARAEHLTFVSSVSVLADVSRPGHDESSAVKHPTPEQDAAIAALDVD